MRSSGPYYLAPRPSTLRTCTMGNAVRLLVIVNQIRSDLIIFRENGSPIRTPNLPHFRYFQQNWSRPSRLGRVTALPVQNTWSSVDPRRARYFGAWSVAWMSRVRQEITTCNAGRWSTARAVASRDTREVRGTPPVFRPPSASTTSLVSPVAPGSEPPPAKWSRGLR